MWRDGPLCHPPPAPGGGGADDGDGDDGGGGVINPLRNIWVMIVNGMDKMNNEC